MADLNDSILLREYAERQSESAFGELVQRHINFVYSVAMRYVGNSADAQDVAQAVFVILARKSGGLRGWNTLTGWLYETTRLTARQLSRTRTRRLMREQEAYMQSTLDQSGGDLSWHELAPQLEEAMSRLRAADRELLALRFYEKKTGEEAALLLGIGAAAAHKRTDRALEKLRNFFTRRGVVSTTAIIAGAISANSIQAAPAGLAETISAVAVAKGAAASTSTLTLVRGALKIMAWTKVKSVIVAGVGILLFAGTATVTVKEIEQQRIPIWQRKYDLSVLARVPPQAKILPAIPFRLGGTWGGGARGMMGLGVGVADILQSAYGGTLGRMIFSVPLPQGKYDFMSNFPQNADTALRQEIKNKFGLTARRELIETNVLVLTISNDNAPGLKRTAVLGYVNVANRDRGTGSYNCINEPISNLIGFLEDYLGVPVIDQTGLKGHYDIVIKGDSTPGGLKRAVLEELGLQLTPSNMPVHMLVVEKAE